MSGRNLYLLGLADAPNRQPDVHETIRAIEAELAKGGAVYAPGEIEVLERKLAEYREMLRVLLNP